MHVRCAVMLGNRGGKSQESRGPTQTAMLLALRDRLVTEVGLLKLQLSVRAAQHALSGTRASLCVRVCVTHSRDRTASLKMRPSARSCVTQCRAARRNADDTSLRPSLRRARTPTRSWSRCSLQRRCTTMCVLLSFASLRATGAACSYGLLQQPMGCFARLRAHRRLACADIAQAPLTEVSRRGRPPLGCASACARARAPAVTLGLPLDGCAPPSLPSPQARGATRVQTSCAPSNCCAARAKCSRSSDSRRRRRGRRRRRSRRSPLCHMGPRPSQRWRTCGAARVRTNARLHFAAGCSPRAAGGAQARCRPRRRGTTTGCSRRGTWVSQESGPCRCRRARAGVRVYVAA